VESPRPTSPKIRCGEEKPAKALQAEAVQMVATDFDATLFTLNSPRVALGCAKLTEIKAQPPDCHAPSHEDAPIISLFPKEDCPVKSDRSIVISGDSSQPNPVNKQDLYLAAVPSAAVSSKAGVVDEAVHAVSENVPTQAKHRRITKQTWTADHVQSDACRKPKLEKTRIKLTSAAQAVANLADKGDDIETIDVARTVQENGNAAGVKKQADKPTPVKLEGSEADEGNEIDAIKILSMAEIEDEQRQQEMGRLLQKVGMRSSLTSWMSRPRADSGNTNAADQDPNKPLAVGAKHFVKKTPLFPPWPSGLEQAMFGMGCFWCAESVFMKENGVFSTQVGFAGGKMIKPTYDAVSLDASFAKTGETGKSDHAELVRVVFDPQQITYDTLLKMFWERHDPTLGHKQGRDEGYQYRSFIGCYSIAQKMAASVSVDDFKMALRKNGISRQITTEIRCPAPHFWYAEEVHQQYEAKPSSRPYYGLSPTGAHLLQP
jgi:peptide-methionine (S)-S-oxide reductase